jgi:hypothetical protein
MFREKVVGGARRVVDSARRVGLLPPLLLLLPAGVVTIQLASTSR